MGLPLRPWETVSVEGRVKASSRTHWLGLRCSDLRQFFRYCRFFFIFFKTIFFRGQIT